MKQPDLNHLRRELTTQQQRVLQIIEAGIARGTPPTRREIANEMGFRSANAADEHVRALATLGFIVVEPGKARNIRPANDVPKGGAAMLRATAESRAVIDVAPGATAGPAQPLSDLAMEEGLAEIGITVWGPRAEDWAAGAEYAVRLMRECLPKAAAETLQDRPDAADTPVAPPALRRDDAGGAGAACRGASVHGDPFEGRMGTAHQASEAVSTGGRAIGHVAVLHSPCGARYFSRITDKHQAEVCAQQWAAEYADVKPGPWPTKAYAVFVAPQAPSNAETEEALAHLRTIAGFGGTFQQAKELAERGLQRCVALKTRANKDGGDCAKRAGGVDKLRAALILARDSHGVVLLSDPPQDAWKARRVDEVIRAALAAQKLEGGAC
ncbi:hypothetical protein CEY09_14700 [Achromobacter marplatensis]|uniref:LexA DNA binding domain-containing protein n=1 Tax=Achromobacter marplatensis TaxID=470868 RepID=A0ABX9GA29_9BURK|nr:hypothetical protein [Achromobacter marplatensis]OWT67750.1 hypothetical protein CEY09_14700 [Achromobacter marplatensis]RBP19780.1 LexA DNA binding domain-containing protein [Achromobacter marplatensis]CAB3637170.1 LexA repressor [Achromobacter marplatensis]